MTENETKIEETEETEELETGVEVEDTDDEPNDSELKAADGNVSDDDDIVVDESKSFGLDEDGEARKPQKFDVGMINDDYKDAVLVNPQRGKVQKHLKRSEAILGADLTKAEEVHKIWTLLEEENTDIKPRKYNMKKADYTETDILTHPTLGKGYIIEILPNSKINVLFEMGVKKLVVNR